MTSLNADSERLLKLIFGADWQGAWVCWKSNMTGSRARTAPLRPGDDSYFSVGLLKAGAHSRANENVVTVNALVIDDVGTKVDKAGMEMLAPVPDWILETSAGNYQWGYVIEGGCSRAEYEALRAAMKGSAVWGHSEGVDAVHLFRLPQGRNTKPGKGNSISGQNVVFPKSGTLGPKNTVNDLLTAFGAPGSSGAQGSQGSGAPSGENNEINGVGLLEGIVKLIPNDGSDREEWVNMAHAVWGASGGRSKDLFDAWSATWSQGSCDPAADDRLWASITHSSIGRAWLMRKAGERDAAGLEGWRRKEAAAVFDDGEEPPADAGEIERVAALQLSVAAHLSKKNAERLRWDVDKVQWRVFDKGTWRLSSFKEGYSEARLWAQKALPGLGKAAAAVAKSGFCEGVEQLMRDTLRCTAAEFDRDDWLLGTPGGTVDLRTGVLRAATAGEMIALSAAVAPADAEDCPKWLRFVDWACTDPATKKVDLGMVRMLKQWAGYCLCGDVAQEKVMFLWGEGGNGKGTFVETLVDVLGDYAHMAEKDLFMETKKGTHTEDIAALVGKRLVAADEVQTNARWNESLLKGVSGGGKMSTRHLFGRSFLFTVKFKVTISGNAKPSFQGTINAALKRRMRLIRFGMEAKPQSTTLKKELWAEAPGVLRWMLNGLMDLRGSPGGALFVADSSISATEGYFNESDLLGQWLDECTKKVAGAETSASDAFRAWQDWRNAAGNHTLLDTAMSWKPEMEKRGFAWKKGMRGNLILGLKMSAASGVF